MRRRQRTASGLLPSRLCRAARRAGLSLCIPGGLLPGRLCSTARRAGFSFWLMCRACGHHQLQLLCAMQCRGLLGRLRDPANASPAERPSSPNPGLPLEWKAYPAGYPRTNMATEEVNVGNLVTTLVFLRS